MKKTTLLGLLLCLVSLTAVAQVKTKAKKIKEVKTVSNKSSQNNTQAKSTTLSSTASYPAFAPSTSLRITDPTINRFNQRAAGADLPISGSGVAGMPKGSYGFANGHLLLRSTTATSSGTGFGSGAVSTGTSIHGLGTSEATIGVNGKSPYAGPWLWGDKLPAYSNTGIDSIRHH